MTVKVRDCIRVYVLYYSSSIHWRHPRDTQPQTDGLGIPVCGSRSCDMVLYRSAGRCDGLWVNIARIKVPASLLLQDTSVLTFVMQPCVSPGEFPGVNLYVCLICMEKYNINREDVPHLQKFPFFPLGLC